MGISTPFKKNILSIDIGSYETKIVEGRKAKKGIHLNRYFSVITPEGAYEDGHILDSQALETCIGNSLKSNKIKTRRTYLTIKSSTIITRVVLMPDVEAEEIEGILKYQLREYLPVDVDEYVVEHKIIDLIEDETGTQKEVLLIAVPKSIVEDHFELLRQLDMRPMVLDFQSNSIAKLISYSDYVNNAHSTAGQTIAIVDFGYDSLSVSIIRDGTIRLSRVIPNQGQIIDEAILSSLYTKEKDLTIDELEGDDGNFIMNMLSNLRAVFRYYESQKKGNKIDMILIYGGISNITELQRVLSRHFDIPTIKMKNVNRILVDSDLNGYLNCIGSLIR